MKNTILGRAKTKDDSKVNFTYSSVIDGTGKELVGKENREVAVKVSYASDGAIVVEDGEDMLIFVKENDKEAVLEENRVGVSKKNLI